MQASEAVSAVSRSGTHTDFVDLARTCARLPPFTRPILDLSFNKRLRNVEAEAKQRVGFRFGFFRLSAERGHPSDFF